MKQPITSTFLEASTGRPIEVFTVKSQTDTKEDIIKKIMLSHGITLNSAPAIIILMAKNLSGNNTVPYSQRQIAKLSGKSTGAVNRVMRILIEKGIVIRTGNVYMLDENIVKICKADKESIGILYR